MLSQIIQSVNPTKNSYGGQAHRPSIIPREVLKVDNLEAALHHQSVIGKIISA